MFSILLILKGFGAYDLLGNSLTAEQRTLTPSVLVRIQVPQPNLAFRRRGAFACFRASSDSGRFRQKIKGLNDSGIARAGHWHGLAGTQCVPGNITQLRQ
jgi:hypothetical protein